jgi:transposase InsO family protein
MSVYLVHARRIVDAWRLDYNRARPHSSLGYPPQFATQIGASTAVEAVPVVAGLKL